MDKKGLLKELYEVGVFKHGNFKTASGQNVQLYIDCREIFNHPILMKKICQYMQSLLCLTDYDSICGVPSGGIPWASYWSQTKNKPIILTRNTDKTHGTKVSTMFKRCLVMDDVLTTGGSIKNCIAQLAKKNIKVAHIIVIFNRSNINEINGIHVDSLYNHHDLNYIINSTNQNDRLSTQKLLKGNSKKIKRMNLLSKIPLCLSIDNPQKFDQIINNHTQYAMAVKLHFDVLLLHYRVETLKTKLRRAAQQNKFLIVWDKKFCDIGSIVQKQYKLFGDIVDIVIVHAIAGEGTIESLIQINHNIKILIVLEMTSTGSLIDDNYKKNVARIALKYQSNVIGFIAKSRHSLEQVMLIDDSNKFMIWTTGISLQHKSDGLNQNYRTPADALSCGSNVLIVGRDIVESECPWKKIQHYKTEFEKYNNLSSLNSHL